MNIVFVSAPKVAFAIRMPGLIWDRTKNGGEWAPLPDTGTPLGQHLFQTTRSSAKGSLANEQYATLPDVPGSTGGWYSVFAVDGNGNVTGTPGDLSNVVPITDSPTMLVLSCVAR
jgi:hypothetical protein